MISVFSFMVGFVYFWCENTEILGQYKTDVVTQNPCIQISTEFIMHNTGYKIILSTYIYLDLTEKRI